MQFLRAQSKHPSKFLNEISNLAVKSDKKVTSFLQSLKSKANSVRVVQLIFVKN